MPVKAVPNKDYQFSSWSGPVANAASAGTTVAMIGLQSITANLSGIPLLSASITGKSGTVAARAWTITLTNSGKAVAGADRINSLAFKQVGGIACRPVVTSAFPVAVGDLLVGASASGTVGINFSGCGADARFSVMIGYSATGSASKNSVIGNQFR